VRVVVFMAVFRLRARSEGNLQLPPPLFCRERAPGPSASLIAYPQPVIKARPVPGPLPEWQPARSPRLPSGKMPAQSAARSKLIETGRLQEGWRARARLRGSGMEWERDSASGVSGPRFNSSLLMRSQ
jgi:hypothetical protein